MIKPTRLRISGMLSAMAVSIPVVSTLPRAGRMSPLISLHNVDLPEPFNPATARNSPCRTSRLSPARADTVSRPG